MCLVLGSFSGIFRFFNHSVGSVMACDCLSIVQQQCVSSMSFEGYLDVYRLQRFRRPECCSTKLQSNLLLFFFPLHSSRFARFFVYIYA